MQNPAFSATIDILGIPITKLKKDMNMKEISKEEMTRLYYDAILAHCNRKLNYEIDAARDITQEVFYELFSHWDGFQSHAEAGLLTWLYRTADILVKKYFRLQKKAKKMESMQNANCIDFDFEVDSALLAKEEKQQYEAYIAEIKENLSDKELQIFEHIILQKYTVSQTARLLDMKENTVMVSLYRLRKKLNKMLDKIISINNSNEGGE